jgi:hypothetical protein
VKIFGLLALWIVLVWVRVNQHFTVYSLSWLTWLIVAHLITAGIGYLLCLDVTARRKAKKENDNGPE